MIDLPSELLNEPYSREPQPPYCKIVRPQRFVFHVEGIIAHCIVGYRLFKSIYATSRCGDRVPRKSVSSCSVLAVYELYGLDISLAYLDHLAVKDLGILRERAWIELYLRSSVFEIQQTQPVSNNNIHTLIDLLKSELRELEQAQPIVTTSLVTCPTLPIEIVARIVSRVDISAQIANILHSTGSIHPTMLQLHRLNKKFDTSCVRVVSGTSYNSCVYVLVTQDRKNNSEHTEWILVKHSGGTLDLVQPDNYRSEYYLDYSLATYDLFYGNKMPANRMLSEIRERLASPSIKDEGLICCWLVQLTHHTYDPSVYRDEVVRFSSLLDVAAELTRLIDLVIVERA